MNTFYDFVILYTILPFRVVNLMLTFYFQIRITIFSETFLVDDFKNIDILSKSKSELVIFELS